MLRLDMDNSIESKPTGSGEATQTNQRPAGLSRKEFKTKHVPLDPSAQRRIRVLLTRQELASRWQCCPHTIQRMKNLRPVRFNRRRLRYRIEDIEAIEAAAVA